jgi:hypothetical protein
MLIVAGIIGFLIGGGVVHLTYTLHDRRTLRTLAEGQHR